MKPRSLRFELARAAFLTTLLALLLMAGSLFVYELATYRDDLVSDLRTQADLIAHSTSAALVFDDKKVAQDNLALLRQKPSIRAAIIFRKDGAEFASYNADDSKDVRLRRDPGLEASMTRFAGPVVDIAYPIQSDNEVVGVLYLEARHDAMQRAGTYVLILIAVTAVSLSTSFIVFGRLQRRITKPLLGMTQVAKQVMEQRDWTLRAADSSNLDVAVLVKAFNGMLSEVQLRTGELERSREELKRLDRRKDEFLATLAHELRNPLAPMMNAATLVKSPGANAAMRDRAATIIDRQLRHMVRLIDDLLDVSRIITGKLSLHRELLDLSALLKAAVELAEPMVNSRRQTLTLDISGPCRVIGDVARLTQVFSNVLNNASKYTPAGGSIQVFVEQEGDTVAIHVKDSGIGIEPSLHERIFELFEQVDKSLERGSAGLGIGLTLARQLVQLHGGRIDVQSEGLGRGACFTVRLPVAREHSATVVPGVRSAIGVRGRMLRILVADDNVDYAQSLAEILSTLGHQVRVVHNGRAAVNAALQEPPDVALLDIGMPELNGYDVARILRQSNLPISLRLIAITGWGQASDKANAVDAGFDAHLVKPVLIEDLVAALAAG